MAIPIKKKLQCGLCGEKFSWLHEGFPDECPVCNQYIGLDGKPEVAAPFISLAARKSPDQVYRAMENGSEHRVNVASELLGVPKADLSDMKITNLKEAHEGENMAPSIPMNPVSMAMMSNPGRYGLVPTDVNSIRQQSQGQVGAGSGAAMIDKVRGLHASHGNVVTTFPTPQNAAKPRIM